MGVTTSACGQFWECTGVGVPELANGLYELSKSESYPTDNTATNRLSGQKYEVNEEMSVSLALEIDHGDSVLISWIRLKWPVGGNELS
jgi:hypothetical protein